MSDTDATFQDFRRVLGVCPCCGEAFRLTDLVIAYRAKPAATWLDNLDANQIRPPTAYRAPNFSGPDFSGQPGARTVSESAAEGHTRKFPLQPPALGGFRRISETAGEHDESFLLGFLGLQARLDQLD